MSTGVESLPDGPERVECTTVLAVSAYEEDHQFLIRYLVSPHWNLIRAGSEDEAAHLLDGHRIGVVLCERDLPDGSWKDLLERLESAPDPAMLIVMSRHADELLWAEVLNLGGYDVLIKPLERNEVQRVTGMAARQWDGRRTKRKRLTLGANYAALCGS
jgi:DNA-binding response OmpR family regulator